MSKRRVHYVLSTHWDREWYQPFQHYRYRLVQLLDHIFSGWQDGRLCGPFQTDGQAIVLEDYLEVRPERRNEAEQLVKAGQLVLGPWYVMPDEFLVSGESLIRNLRMGRAVARQFGGQPSNAGFICDIFGHNSQMPQIFSGFGIQAVFLWRGSNQIEKRLLRWRAADGTEMVCYRFGHVGYCDYAFKVRHADQAYRVFDKKEAAKDLWQFIEQEANATQTSSLLIFDGGDHLEWNPDHYAVYLEQSKNPKPGYELLHTSLDAFMSETVKQIKDIPECVNGEMRETGHLPDDVDQSWLIPGVLSSRAWIKQENTACESLLCLWAEPLSVFSSGALKEEHPSRFLDIAWKWLVQNHPHDSICGCSIDQVHEDMKYRFSQCRQIAARLSHEAAQKITASIEGEIKADELRLVLFNPLAQPLNQVIDVTLAIPEEWPVFNEFFGFEAKPGFRIYDAESGKEIPYQRLRQTMGRSKFRIFPRHFPQPFRTNDVTVALALTIPAMGYVHLLVRRSEAKIPTRHATKPGLVVAANAMENALLRMEVRENGSLTLTDKRSGQKYDRLMIFEDSADIGDGWFHGQAVNDQVFSTCAARSQVSVVHDGPLYATLRLRTTLTLPRAFRFDVMRRDEECTEMQIESLLTLRRESDVLEIQTSIDNHVDDHRLRVLFPTGCQSRTYLCDNPFDVVEREIALSADNHTYRELEVETRSQQSWTAVFDQHRGLAIISTGLRESTVQDLPDRPIALTLFRSTRRTVFTDGEPLGQLHQSLHFRYLIKPLCGAPDRRECCVRGQWLSGGVMNILMNENDRRQHGSDTPLPNRAGAFLLEGDVVMTSCRRLGDFVEMRLFNPTEHTVMASISTPDRPAAWPAPTRVQYVDLESNPLTQPQAMAGGKLSVPVPAKKIITLRFLD